MKKQKGWAMKAEKAANQARKARKAAREKPHGGYPTLRTPGAKMLAEKAKNRKRRKRSKAPSWRTPSAPDARI